MFVTSGKSSLLGDDAIDNLVISRLLSVLPADTKRFVAAGRAQSHISDSESTMSPVRETEDSLSRVKKKKSTKGWDGEVDPVSRNAYFADDDGE